MEKGECGGSGKNTGGEAALAGRAWGTALRGGAGFLAVVL